MFKIKDKETEDVKELELVYDNDGNIELKIDGGMLMCFFQDGDITLEEDVLKMLNIDLLGWSR